MANLEKRIEALEQVQVQPDGATFKTVIVQFVEPGHLDEPINHLSTRDGEAWTRHDGEPEQAFKDRASREVQRSPWGVALLLAEMERDHAPT